MNVFSKVRTPAQTPFERERAKEINELYQRGLDPLSIESHSSGGSYRYTYNDIANYMEQYNIPYSLTLSLFKLTKKKNDEYERKVVKV